MKKISLLTFSLCLITLSCSRKTFPTIDIQQELKEECGAVKLMTQLNLENAIKDGEKHNFKNVSLSRKNSIITMVNEIHKSVTLTTSVDLETGKQSALSSTGNALVRGEHCAEVKTIIWYLFLIEKNKRSTPLYD